MSERVAANLSPGAIAATAGAGAALPAAAPIASDTGTADTCQLSGRHDATAELAQAVAAAAATPGISARSRDDDAILRI